MTRIEFMKKYGIENKGKAIGVVNRLISANQLTYEKYVMATITDVLIAKVTPFSKVTLSRWRNNQDDEKSKFLLDVVSKRAIQTYVVLKELELASKE
ncbi:MAG: hypothetical protein U9Q66_00485 [Patescibacteria group bacterium]|nr:hypothetical protein [Patescibacteria group bacterium]